MKKYILLLNALCTISCNNAQQEKLGTLIKNVNIVDVHSGQIISKQNIIVTNGKFSSITASSSDNNENFRIVIDGSNKYVMPGLAEMHAHIPQPREDGNDRIEETLFLYLSNGITTIRGMLGHPHHLKLREEAKKDSVLSPRIFTSSPSMNGNSVKTKEEAIAKVTQYKKDGYDFLKIHPGIKREVFDQMVQTANKVGITFAGHVPVDVGILHALNSGYTSIDHIDGFLEGLVPESANVNPNQNGFFGYNFTDLADVSKIDGLVQLSKQNKVWIVPTQSLFDRWFAPVDAEKILAQPEMQYMPKSTLDNWYRSHQNYTQNQAFSLEKWSKFNDIRMQLLKKLQENGQGILLGSDAPQVFNVPGFSIHHEMQGMKNAGLTNLEIIRSGTINPATFFDMNDTFGEIKVGLSADFILIDANPIEDIKALKQLSGVMLRGQWLSKKTIDSKLKEIANKVVKN